MENKYSLAIHPSEEIIELIKAMKKELSEKVGWFHSKNSLAHITICNFTATDQELEVVKEQLRGICKNVVPFEVHLNGFGSYENGAFFISPDNPSVEVLRPLMKRFHNHLSIRGVQLNEDPHISIARRLSPRKLEIAGELFSDIDLTFQCDAVVLRIFDKEKKQYFVNERFEFAAEKNKV